MTGLHLTGTESADAGAASWACLSRGLARSAAWLAQLQLALGGAGGPPEPDEMSEAAPYLAGRTLVECREYARAAHVTAGATTPRTRFLHLYARYLAAETTRLDGLTEAGCSADASKSEALRELYATLREDYAARKLDGYMLYLYGIVLKKLELQALAIRVLEEAVNAVPWLWGAWLELSTLPKNRETLESLNLPHHCMTNFFLARAYLEQKSPDEALVIYETLKVNGFEKFTYLNAQMAVAYHDQRDVENAIATFKVVQQSDPYRIENLDIYSHLLYVKEMRTELANLAHRVVQIDKYRVETCCIIGNYYSLRNEHQKAVVYFQRALKLNPNYLSAWILMGHEFIELQNTNAAILAYRHAIEVNRNDYRAWNGLGQAYEILGLNGYCLYYYARAAQQCPNDSRMLVALGEAFEKLDKITNALKCYHRAHSVGDIEGMAILKLAKLYDKLKMRDSAAAAYTAACSDVNADSDKGLHEAYKYLANFHLDSGKLEIAHNYAFKCLDYEETKEEGKSLLKVIANRKSLFKESRKRDIPEEDADSHNISTSSLSTSKSNSPPQPSGIFLRYKL